MTRPNGQHEWTAEQDEKLLRMTAEKMPVSVRARALGLSEGQIRSRLTRLRSEIPVYVDEPRTADTAVEWAKSTTTNADSAIPVAKTAASLPDRVDELVKLAKRGVTLEDLCDRMDLSPKRLRELVEEAQRRGSRVDIDGPHVGHRPAQATEDTKSVIIQPAGDRFVAAEITDLHFGSRYHLGAQLRDYVQLAYDRGVRTMLVGGDVLEGCYRHAQWELTHHGFHDQANFCAETLPEHPGLTYHTITGNHDQTFSDANGMSVGHALVDVFASRGRHDLIFHGDRGARLALKARPQDRGLVVDLWHPLKGPAYALSYKLQKKVEGYVPGDKPDVVIAGHWHQSVYFNTRGVHAFSGGCFQGGGGPYGKALGGAPSIGGWIFEWAQTADGTVRRFAPEWVGYFEHEAARDVAVSA